MYDYRKMTPEQRAEVVAARKARGYPWHSPPHSTGESTYLLSGACFEHKHILASPTRLTEFEAALLAGFDEEAGGTLHAWVVLPNHWHILGNVDLSLFRKWIGRLHNGKSTQWNREDNTPRRKVWHGFSDRWMRGERHFYASLNYIHGNPVKHGFVGNSSDWPWSSLHEYLERVGRQQLVTWWREYPVKDFGRGWDD
jgi:putative transposase